MPEAHGSFLALLDSLQRSAENVATVHREDDPKNPRRSGYLISGPTCAAVQDAIDTITATVDTARGGVPGMARFLGPIRSGAEWCAMGEVMREVAA